MLACICFNKLKRPTHWFVCLLCSVFKGLPCCVSNFYIISEWHLIVNSFLKVFSLVVFQLRSGCLSDLIRITNDLLFVNNFFQLILLMYQHQLTVLKLRLRYNIICRAVRQLLFSILFRNSFSHLAHVIIYQDLCYSSTIKWLIDQRF